MCGRPYGGTAILIDRKLKCTIEPIFSDCDRLCAIIVKFNCSNVLLVNCYMPCDNSANSDECSQVLGAPLELRTRINPDYTIYGGDFNIDLGRL